MACNASTLTADSRCLAAGMSDHQLLAAFLCVLATSNGMTCDPDTLIADSLCLAQGMSNHQLLASIACTLADSGGVGGSGYIFHGSGAPSGAQPGQTDLTKAAIYYDDDPQGQLYVWNVAAAAWE